MQFPDINKFILTSEQRSLPVPKKSRKTKNQATTSRATIDLVRIWNILMKASILKSVSNLIFIKVDCQDEEVAVAIDYWRKELSFSLERTITALSALRKLEHDSKKKSDGKSQILMRCFYGKTSKCD